MRVLLFCCLILLIKAKTILTTSDVYSPTTFLSQGKNVSFEFTAQKGKYGYFVVDQIIKDGEKVISDIPQATDSLGYINYYTIVSKTNYVFEKSDPCEGDCYMQHNGMDWKSSISAGKTRPALSVIELGNSADATSETFTYYVTITAECEDEALPIIEGYGKNCTVTETQIRVKYLLLDQEPWVNTLIQLAIWGGIPAAVLLCLVLIVLIIACIGGYMYYKKSSYDF